MLWYDKEFLENQLGVMNSSIRVSIPIRSNLKSCRIEFNIAIRGQTDSLRVKKIFIALVNQIGFGPKIEIVTDVL